MKLRLSAAQLALSYVALGALALALLAIPHWDGFHASEADFRAYVVRAVVILAALGFVFAWLLRSAHRQLEGQVGERTAALRRSEELFALAVEGSTDGIWEWDLRTGMAYFSPRCQELFGRPSDGIDIRPKEEWLRWHHYHPEDAPLREAAIRDHLEGRTPHYEGEWRVRHPDGSYHWVHGRGVCTRDASGRPLRFAGSTSDIDARKRTESALRLSEERYAHAMDASEEAYFDHDSETGELFVSERLNEFYDTPRGTQLAARDEYLRDVRFHPDDAAKYHDTIAAAVAPGGPERYELEFRVLRPSGGVRWLRTRGKVTRGVDGRALRRTGVVADITQSKLAAEALRASEERYSLAMEASEEGHFDHDVRTGELFVSERLNEIHGIPAGTLVARRDEYLKRTRLHPDDVAKYHGVVDAAMAPGGPARYQFEFRVLRPSGEVGWFRTRGMVMRDAEGRALRRIGVVADITGSRLAEEALRESEARFRALNELSSDWYWRQDENLRFTYLSTDIGSVDGLAGRSAIGKTRWELDIAPVSCTWEEHRAMLAERKTFRDMEYSRSTGNGRTQYVTVSGAPVFDEQGVFRGYQGVGRDITGRKRGEAKLQESEARFRALIELSSDWYWKQDVDLRFTYISDQVTRNRIALERVIGLKRRELVGVTPLTSGWDEHEAVLAAHQPFRDFEYTYEGPDGRKQYASISGAPVFDESGAFLGYQGVGRNINYRKAAEEELRALERKLRQAQRLEAMGTLAGGIAHDFNNILGAILGYGEMAMRDAAQGTRLRRDLDSIMAAGERGRALVDRVLAFSRSGVGERVPVHVEKVAREALDLLSAKLPPDITLHARLHARNAAMLGDATQVHQVLMNLVINAAQAMAGGGILRVSLRADRLGQGHVPTVGAIAAGDYLVLEVVDTGSGIAADILDRIFDPFFTTKEVGTGTGLGLSLVHGIVTELGGAIDVASAVGEGTTFTVYLPRTGDVVEAETREEHELPRGDGQRVLVVDDEEPLVVLAVRVLEELGYAPQGFTSSSAALAAFRADPHRFDAVITDERMPGLPGIALIREMRGIRERMPIVLMSGYVGGAIAAHAREAGAEEVLKKPLSARDLAASLARALRS